MLIDSTNVMEIPSKKYIIYNLIKLIYIKKTLQSIKLCSKILNVVTWHTMMLEIAIH